MACTCDTQATTRQEVCSYELPRRRHTSGSWTRATRPMAMCGDLDDARQVCCCGWCDSRSERCSARRPSSPSPGIHISKHRRENHQEERQEQQRGQEHRPSTQCSAAGVHSSGHHGPHWLSLHYLIVVTLALIASTPHPSSAGSVRLQQEQHRLQQQHSIAKRQTIRLGDGRLLVFPGSGRGGAGPPPKTMTIQRISKDDKRRPGDPRNTVVLQVAEGPDDIIVSREPPRRSNASRPAAFTRNCVGCESNVSNVTTSPPPQPALTVMPKPVKLHKHCEIKAQSVRLAVPGCAPTRVTIKKCRGKCRSSLKPVAVEAGEPGTLSNMFRRKRCRCCQATKVEVKTVELRCGNELKTHRVASAVTCDCSPCQRSD